MSSVVSRKVFGVAIATSGIAGTVWSLNENLVPVRTRKIRTSDIYALKSRETLRIDNNTTDSTLYRNDSPRTVRASDIFVLRPQELKIETKV